MTVSAVRRLPRWFSLWAINGVAGVVYLFAANERKKTLRHLALALGKTRAGLGRQIFRNIGQNLVDAILLKRLLSWDPEAIMKINGLNIAQSALARGKGLIFLTAHTGCFEMMPARLSLLGLPIMVLGARAYDPRLNQLIVHHRESFHVTYLQRDHDLREIIRGLRAGKALGILCDLDTRVESRFIPYFGMPAKTSVGPFKLGIKLGAPLIPVFTLRQPDGTQTMTVYPEIIPQGVALEEQVLYCMARFNTLLEGIVRSDPAQWIWMHERWKSKP